MKSTTTITVTIDRKQYTFPFGSTVEEILTSFASREIPVVGAFVNGYVRGMHYSLIIDCEIKWIDLQTHLGRSIYRNSLKLLLVSAHNNVLPDRELFIRHTLGDGTYCESRGEAPFTEEMRQSLIAEMERLVKEATPIERKVIFSEDARALCAKNQNTEQEELLSASSRDKFSFYALDKTVERIQGNVVSNCSTLSIFELMPFHSGFILRAPTSDSPAAIVPELNIQNIGTLFLRFDHWAESLQIDTVGELNRAIRYGNVSRLIEMAEMMQMQNIFEIGQKIIDDIENIRILLIAGPSSSGKTTFSHKLSTYFKINGIEPLTLAMDDYFVDRKYTPLDANGELDFESVDCVDFQRFDDDLNSLIQGKVTETPIFDFTDGHRKEETRRMQMGKNQILVIEGIHCLNEKIAANVPAKNKRRLFMSVLTQLNIDNYNPISSTDNRLLRRMTRDKATRNTSPAETIMRWESVQQGEFTNIYPFRENADFFCNTSLIYEMAVLKPFIEPALMEIGSDHRTFNEAKRLLNILDFMRPIDASHVPPNSLLREFIGGSAFSADPAPETEIKEK